MSEFPMKMEMEIDNFFDDEIDVEIMVLRYPKCITIDLLEYGSYSKNVKIFRDDNGAVKLKITDFNSKMEIVEGRPKYKKESTFTLIEERESDL